MAAVDGVAKRSKSHPRWERNAATDDFFVSLPRSMSTTPALAPPLAAPDQDFLVGGGKMGALMRSLDWSRTALGPVASWPQSLRTSVSTCLNCAFPILLWWGPELVMLYNDE